MPARAFQSIKYLHSVVTKEYQTTGEMLDNYLNAGCNIFGLSIGIASLISGDQYKVLSVSKNSMGINKGDVFSLNNTYCREVIEKAKTIAVDEAGKTEPFKSHPIYENLKLESYISAPIYVDGAIVGTINFSSTQKRKKLFQDFDRELIELMADSASQFIKRQQDLEQMEKQKMQLFATSKLKSLGEMAGGIAHEINNPLTVIASSTELSRRLLSRSEFPEKTGLLSKLECIDRTVGRISEIIEGMRTLLHDDQEEDYKVTKFNDLIDLTLPLCRERIESSNIELRLETDADVSINCNSTQMSQVLMNLLSNAVDAVKDVYRPKIIIKTYQTAKSVVCEVIDSGYGVPEEVEKKIFEPFYSTKPVGKGTGLGLSISKSIVQKHGGSIHYKKDMRGTVFSIEIPKLQMAAAS